MNIDIPEEFINDFELRRGMLREVLLLGLHQLRMNEALLLYKQSVVSFGRAAELAKLSRQEMIQQVRVAGVEPRWSEDMLRSELA